jgi:hypothetical protein
MRDLKVGDLVVPHIIAAAGGVNRPWLVLEVSDTGKPRYGTQKGTRRLYRLVEPASGLSRWFPETQIRVEFKLS